jgi:hypothetical protein
MSPGHQTARVWLVVLSTARVCVDPDAEAEIAPAAALGPMFPRIAAAHHAQGPFQPPYSQMNRIYTAFGPLQRAVSAAHGVWVAFGLGISTYTLLSQPERAQIM